MTFCLPKWYPLYDSPALKSFILTSGCSMGTPSCSAGLSAGNINCNPAQMAAQADQKLRATGYMGPAITLDAYTLARYIASEVGSSATPGEKVAVAEAAVNRARRWKLSITGLLLNRSPAPNKGYFGPIHCSNPDGSLGAPYGRWAATSKDPSAADVMLALLVTSGESNNFSRGADDQFGPDIEGTSSHPTGWAAKAVAAKGEANNYWVGPLPGVDHWRTFLFTYRPDISPTSAQGKALIAAGVQALTNRTRPNWTGLPMCSTGVNTAAIAALATAGIASFFLYRYRDLWIKHLIP